MTEDTKPKTDVVNQHTGEKWYYTDTVKDHFFKPRNILLSDPKPGEFDAEGMVGSPACILPTTLLQKNPSVGTIDTVAPGDRVLSHDGNFYKIKRIFRPLYQNLLVSIKNQLGEITATKDHLIYALQVPRERRKHFFMHTKYKKLLPFSWVHAGDLKRGDIVLYPIPKITRLIKEIKLPVFGKKKFDFRSKNLPQKLSLNNEVLELFGYFVAEGHTKKDGKELGFTFGISETIFVRRVCYLLKKYFNVSASYKKLYSHNRINIVAHNVQLARLFREWFGHSAAAKHIPDFILFLSPEVQAGFIRGVWRGDGYFNTARSQPRAGFATISKTLLHQMRWLLLRQKIIPSMYQERARIKSGVRHQAAYRIHVGDMSSLEKLARILDIRFLRDPHKRHAEEVWHDNDYFYVPVRRIQKKKFKGRLSNLEVETSHTYATDAFLVHNCGDMMNMWLKVDPQTERVTTLKWRTFGCASAIAATSMFSVMITENGGMNINDALKIKPQDIMMRLGGLPNRKIHCSVLADKAFRKAANDWFRKNGQYDNIKVEGARIVDERLHITDKDIEEAVLEGATDLESVQKKLKAGIGDPGVVADVEQLIRFYKEKYYG